MQGADYGTLCRRLAVAGVLLGLVAIVVPRVDAHKGLVSPFTYNQHVFPILRDRCGACHFDGGPTPMSLMTYADAQPWAEAMRAQLISEAMPPWYADPRGPALRGGHTISARELDILITWASGGAPEGDASRKPGLVPHRMRWKLGEPDLVLTMSAVQALPAYTTEDTREFVFTTGLKEMRWVTAVDLLPGAPSMVHDATVQIENGPVLALWGPGNDAIPEPDGAAFKLEAGARIRLKMHYKKNYRDVDQIVEDRSRLGLYFAKAFASGEAIQTLDLQADSIPTGSGPEHLAATVKGATRVLALRPSLAQSYQSIAIEAVLPTGRRSLLLLRAARADWPRRYWLSEPVDLPPGARIEAIASPAPRQSGGKLSIPAHTLQLSIDFIVQRP